MSPPYGKSKPYYILNPLISNQERVWGFNIPWEGVIIPYPLHLTHNLRQKGVWYSMGKGFNIPCEGVNISIAILLDSLFKTRDGVKISWVGCSIYHGRRSIYHRVALD